jgi:ectoine hydroxylase-related dioxygenase (phytanoyl-CoA dioxygenase family)
VGSARFSDVPDNLIVNFPVAAHPPQTPTQRANDVEGWHKDGDWFRHFLDSPEQGLLGIVLWRDVEDGQGPTCVAVDSIGPVADLLASHPEGLDPAELKDPIARIVRGCSDIRPITGSQGTIIFAHPFLIHAASVNTSATPRVISNTSVMLRDPMRFDRDEGTTAVERSILHHLGVDRLQFEPRGDRGTVTSERERRWAQREAGS